MSKNVSTKYFIEKYHKNKYLTKEQEYNFIQKAQLGNVDAVEELILTNLAFIKKKVHFGLYLSRKPELDDYIQVGIIGFIQAIQKFDISKGFRLKTYGNYYIQKEVHYLAENSSIIRVPKYQWTKHKDKNVSLYNALGLYLQYIQNTTDKEIEPDEKVVVNKRDKEAIEEMLNSLKEISKYAKPLIKGFYLQNKQWKQLAKELKISKNKVHKIKTQSLKYLQGYLKRRNIHCFGDLI